MAACHPWRSLLRVAYAHQEVCGFLHVCIKGMSVTQEVLEAIESRALARSNGDAVEAFNEQRLERLVPSAS